MYCVQVEHRQTASDPEANEVQHMTDTDDRYRHRHTQRMKDRMRPRQQSRRVG